MDNKEKLSSPLKKNASDIRANSCNDDPERAEKLFQSNITHITKDLSKLNSKGNDNCIVYYIKTTPIDHKIFIEVHYIKGTKANVFNENIVFLFEMNEQYPDTTPKLSCMSSFTFPSLSDNRNFIKEVSGYSKGGKCRFASIIVKDIPDLIRRYTNDIANKIYSFIGEYRLERLFVINDFTHNPGNCFYKATIQAVGNYLILTDIALLFFIPYEKRLERGKLYLVVELKDIKEVISAEGKEMTGVKVVFNEGGEGKEKVIAMRKEKLAEFEAKLQERMERIKGMFTFFQKESLHSSNKQFDYTQDDGIEEIIAYKESILSQIKLSSSSETATSSSSSSPNKEDVDKEMALKDSNKKQIIRDLIELYQKAIEIYSAKSDPQYKAYIDKLRVFVEENGNGL